MSANDETGPEADRLSGAPHPRHAPRVYGHAEAEAEFLEAFNSGRLHHGWLISGPEGVGKATLAWRLARFLLTQPLEDGGLFGAPEPPSSLDTDPNHPIAHQIAAGASPGLFVLRRAVDDKSGQLKTQITIDVVRRLRDFFGLSSSDGGRRVVIVDSADEMTPQAANALLKLLEEPPARATLLLISHQPSRLLPTIRSRCRTLRLAPLGAEDLAAVLAESGTDMPAEAAGLAALAGGSAGAAIELLRTGGLDIYAEIIALLASLPRLDAARAQKLADGLAGRANAERLDLTINLLSRALARLARTGALGAPSPEAVPGEAEALVRLAPDPHAARDWATLGQEITARLRHGQSVNLDPAALILDTLFRINDMGARHLSRR